MKELLLKILATWRITNLIVDLDEDGPWSLMPRIRYKIGVRFDSEGRRYGTNEIARAMDCPWCASIWVGILVALVPKKLSFLLYPLALSAGTILIHKVQKSLDD